MTVLPLWCRLILPAALLTSSCYVAPPPDQAPKDPLVGAWRSQVRFTSGTLAEMRDLQFMYVFNAGGTMMESSNYDGSPPGPPAYGIWKKSSAREFEATYEFYNTKAPASFDEIAKGGGWLPNGRGVLSETITLADDGNSFRSTVTYTAFDQAGNLIDGGGNGEGLGARMRF